MNDGSVVGKIVQQQEIARLDASQQSRDSLDASLKALKGQVVNAKVLEVTPEGKAYLEIAGQILEVNATAKMEAGQTLLVKIQAIEPNLIFDILFADNKGLEKSLITALRNVLTSDARLSDGFRSLGFQLQNLDLKQIPELPREMILQLQKILSAIDVKADSQEVVKAIKSFIQNSGLNLEWQLSNFSDEKDIASLQNNLKVMLGQLLESVGKQLLATRSEAAPEPQLINQLMNLVTNFKTEIERLALPGEARNRMLKAVDGFLRSLENLGKGEEQSTRMLDQFSNLQKELAALAGDKSIPQVTKTQVENLMRQVLQNIESRFPIPEEGREFVNRLMLAGLEKEALQIREKLDAAQVLSSPIADRPVSPHLILPVSILNELTDVQIKQLASGGKKGKKEQLTVVMLLELETLGKLRIDALNQQKALYVNVAVEKPEVIDLVDSLRESFAKQLEERGMKLAKLVCRLDGEKIKEFHQLDSQEIPVEQGLINLKV